VHALGPLLQRGGVCGVQADGLQDGLQLAVGAVGQVAIGVAGTQWWISPKRTCG